MLLHVATTFNTGDGVGGGTGSAHSSGMEVEESGVEVVVGDTVPSPSPSPTGDGDGDGAGSAHNSVVEVGVDDTGDVVEGAVG